MDDSAVTNPPLSGSGQTLSQARPRCPFVRSRAALARACGIEQQDAPAPAMMGYEQRTYLRKRDLDGITPRYRGCAPDELPILPGTSDRHARQSHHASDLLALSRMRPHLDPRRDSSGPLPRPLRRLSCLEQQRVCQPCPGDERTSLP